jgi:hypothetical protein
MILFVLKTSKENRSSAIIDSGIDTLHEDLKEFCGRIPKKYPAMVSMMMVTGMRMTYTAGTLSGGKTVKT